MNSTFVPTWTIPRPTSLALVDPSDLRRAQRQIEWPAAQAFASVGELITSGTEISRGGVVVADDAQRGGRSWPV